jgi:hypothetical protein
MAPLIIVAIVAFLLVDAYAVYYLFKRRKTAGAYGTFRIPGEARVTISSGRKMKVTYEEAKGSAGDDEDFDVPAELAVTVSSPRGQPVTLKGPGFKGMGSSTLIVGDRRQALVGSFEATESGAYTVSAQGTLTNRTDPRILLGS